MGGRTRSGDDRDCLLGMGSTTCCPVALRQPRPRQVTGTTWKRVVTNKKLVQVSWLMRTAMPMVL